MSEERYACTRCQMVFRTREKLGTEMGKCPVCRVMFSSPAHISGQAFTYLQRSTIEASPQFKRIADAAQNGE